MLHRPTPLGDWRLDEAFLQRALEAARQADLVTLDVFDTALTRLVDSPVDAFAEMERRLALEIGEPAAGYAQAREDSEQAARVQAHRLRGAEEIGLDAILEQLVRMRPALAPHRARLHALELEVERSLLVGVPDMLELARRLQKAGIAYAFVSDMYLPPDFIAGCLTRAGYGGWSGLHVSCETGATKATGRQWPIVLGRHPVPPERLLHIGDDAHADVALPGRYGLRTLLYERARSERRLGGRLRPALLPFSSAQRQAVLEARRAPAFGEDDAAFWRRQGRVLGGIVLAAFVRWLEARVRRHGIDTLYFCARDGWLIQRAWQVAGADRRTGVRDRYLCISRRPLNLARGHLESTPARLQPSLLGFLAGSDGNVTVGEALRRAGLAGDATLSQAAAAQFGGLGQRLVWPDGTGAFEGLLQEHASTVHAALAPAHHALMQYLRQEQFAASGRCGLVDLGWHASMQRSLRALVEADRGAPISLRGFYYGLWTAALGNRFGAGPCEAAFGGDFAPVEEHAELHAAVEILEELHSAPHGTVISYRQENDLWSPVFADNPLELAQYEATTRHFQDGALETVASLFAEGHCGPLSLDALTPDAVCAALGAICTSPTPRELEAFGRLGHCATFDHTIFEPILAGPCPADAAAMKETYRRSGWRFGTLRAWFAAAQADPASADRAPVLRDLAREALAHHGERVLRQFA